MSKLALLVGLAALVAGALPPARETKPEADARPKAPQALYQECRQLQAQLDEADATVKQLDYQLRRTRTAVANFEFVRKRNAEILARLEKWVDSTEATASSATSTPSPR